MWNILLKPDPRDKSMLKDSTMGSEADKTANKTVDKTAEGDKTADNTEETDLQTVSWYSMS